MYSKHSIVVYRNNFTRGRKKSREKDYFTLTRDCDVNWFLTRFIIWHISFFFFQFRETHVSRNMYAACFKFRKFPETLMFYYGNDRIYKDIVQTKIFYQIVPICLIHIVSLSLLYIDIWNWYVWLKQIRNVNIDDRRDTHVVAVPIHVRVELLLTKILHMRFIVVI